MKRFLVAMFLLISAQAFSQHGFVTDHGIIYPQDAPNCTNASISASVGEAATIGGGTVDARGCGGTMTISGFTLGVSGGSPVALLTGPSKWNMTGTITLNRGSAIIGQLEDSTTFTWTSDINGITTPSGATGGLVLLENLTLVNGSLQSASHAVVNLFDCPRCKIKNVQLAFDSTSASAGVRIQPTTGGSSSFGTWQGEIDNLTVERTQSGTATSGQIGLDIEGNSAVVPSAEGSVFLWTIYNSWIEAQSVDVRLFDASGNTFFGGNIFGGQTLVQIAGDTKINSNENQFVSVNFGSAGVSPTLMTIDSHSFFNVIGGGASGPWNGGGNGITDNGGGNIKFLNTGSGGGLWDFSSSNVNIGGNLNVGGTLTKASGAFKIDHPLDPAEKYLYHSFVESPDMMNIYNGNATTDKQGLATVVLPDYFEALNQDFRYELTVVGKMARAVVSKKIAHNRFVIKTDKPFVEVSWQVTGIRHDAYANAHRIVVEQDKSGVGQTPVSQPTQARPRAEQ